MNAIETVTVYRIEHEVEHVGPYCDWQFPGSEQLEAMYLAHTDAAHPGPRAEPALAALIDPSDFYFAFESIAQCQRWFGGWFGVLNNTGFILRVYEVPVEHVILATKQCIFRMDEAELVEERSLLTLN